MTLLQARFIQFFTLIGCSMRSTAGNYYARYNPDGSLNVGGVYKGIGGNQIDGIILREEAIVVLQSKGIVPGFDVNGTDLTYEDYKKLYRRKKK